MSAKATGRRRPRAPRRARCTTSRSRPPKPMPPNGRSPPSANRSGLSFIAMARPHARRKTRSLYGQRLPGSDKPPRLGLHPDDTTPIPRPSYYYGRGRTFASAANSCEVARQSRSDITASSTPAPAASDLLPNQIDKCVLTIAEPKRLRDKAHLKFVASQACLVCGRQPCDPHHLRFAQPRL